MANDPREEDVTGMVIFEGVMLMCINNQGHTEVGFIRCPRHEPKMTITVQAKVGKDRLPMPDAIPQMVVNFRISSDLYIKAVNPVVGSGAPISAPGEEWDFAKHPDLESDDFHKVKVPINTAVLTNRVCVNAAGLYTYKETLAAYDLVEWKDKQDIGTIKKPFGKLSKLTGLNLVCDDRILIFDPEALRMEEVGSLITLPKLPNNFYEIRINNDCEGLLTGTPRKGTDFREYYLSNVISPKDKNKFDFNQQPGTRPSPEVCERAFLSETDTLGMPIIELPELLRLAEQAEKAAMERKLG